MEGFGHSDLLIGEESYKKVFPHMISHMKSAEQGGGIAMNMEKCSSGNELLLRASYDGNGGFGGSVQLIMLIMFVVFVASFLVGMNMK